MAAVVGFFVYFVKYFPCRKVICESGAAKNHDGLADRAGERSPRLIFLLRHAIHMKHMRLEGDVILDVALLAGGPILSGAPSGRHLFAKLVEVLPPEPKAPEPLFLNFEGVEVATASFLRESVLAFRTFVRGRKSNFYPAIANAKSDIIDELFELVHLRGDVLMTCTIDENGQILRCLHVGSLDPMQQITFDLVNAHGETTAVKLSETENSSVKATAWNNRLSSLSGLGLISERNQGRTKIYQPIFHGEGNGS